ncbi:hypothetical protein VPH35_133632 [Triticum aestivum]
MAPQKRRRKNPAPPIVIEWTLPSDLLLEIVARSDPSTFVRCAATCKLLRRDILDPSFIRRVTQPGGIMPSCILAYLHARPKRNRSNHPAPLLSLVHPATTSASRLIQNNLAPYMLRRDVDLLRHYRPVTRRGGLIALRRHKINRSNVFQRNSSLCVYNPMTDDRTYLSHSSAFYPSRHYTFVLLTAADGIGCSFMLLVVDVGPYQNGGRRITVEAAKSSKVDGAIWGPMNSIGHRHLPFQAFQDHREAVVLHGGVIHWLFSDNNKILIYDIRTERLGTMKLPPTNSQERSRHLGTSSDGRLRVLTAKRFMISLWVHQSDCWAKEAVINVEEKLLSLHPHISPARIMIEFQFVGEKSGAVLLWAYRSNQRQRQGPLTVLDLETKEMRKQDWYPFLLFEVDLSSRLQTMKIFS